MSVSFYGLTADRKPIGLDIEDPAHLNMASSNARAFLLFIGIEPGADPSGEVTMPEARRSVMCAGRGSRAGWARSPARGATRSAPVGVG